VTEAVAGVRGREVVEHALPRTPQRVAGAAGQWSQALRDLGEVHFNMIEIETVPIMQWCHQSRASDARY
jgi:hypothetical protein